MHMSAEWKSVFQQRINELYQRSKDRDYKLTQEGYATKLGTSRNSLRGWLAGTGQPDADGFAQKNKPLNAGLLQRPRAFPFYQVYDTLSMVLWFSTL